MSNLLFIKGQIPPLTPEQKAELAALDDREIDYSDIPPLTDEELARMKPVRLREDIWKKIRARTIEDKKKPRRRFGANFFAV